MIKEIEQVGKPQDWRDLSPAQRKNSIAFQLLILEVGAVDAEFGQWYTNAKTLVTNDADRMRLDVELFNQVGVLRREGKLRPAHALQTQAATMIDLDPEGMVQAFNDFAKSLSPQKEQ